MTNTEQLQEVAAEVKGAASALRAASSARVIDALANAARRLVEAGEGEEALGLLAQSSGLSEPMVRWALRHAVELMDEEALTSLLKNLGPAPGYSAAPATLHTIILAGNVFTAALKPVAVSLLARSPVLAKASSKDDVFPRLLKAALREVDEELSSAYGVVTFPGGSERLEDTMIAQADVVSVYGSDHTIAEIRRRLPATTHFVAHGHGLGAIYVPKEALADSTTAEEVAEAVALDVAAYDQRGCLSPHAVWVEAGGVVGAEELARMIASTGLERLRSTLPRGPLPTEVGAVQVQWRGVALTRGELFEGDGYGVSFENAGPFRLSPGYRNVSVLECAGVDELGACLRPLGVHLKALGVAGGPEVRERTGRLLPAPLAPRIYEVGTMQKPPLHSLADGLWPAAGIMRLRQID